ncbi:hypothetical protein ALC62_14317 [Cyphomyrmex costatus]|uniref:Envelope fusion protein n=1 Tax=Cyphomyrmex costatus TaxID=456900 RepID=A0A151I975_9HYME|nr:hypothetical protein ALC62_14317 [Cyphomyrmex costatus]
MNEYILANVTKKLKTQLLTNEKTINLHEHFIVINAILNDLIRDAQDILEYLVFIRVGTLNPRVAPLSAIIENLKETSLQLSEELHFPFKIGNNEWPTIEKTATITAYCDSKSIFTILQFPLVAPPKYKLINTITLPVTHHNNVFVNLEIKNPLIAVNIEGHSYIIITENNLQKCRKLNSEYLCNENFAIRRANLDKTCEIEIYLGNTEYNTNCKVEKTIINNTLWIPLNNPHSWLYTTAKTEEIYIQCKDHGKIKRTIENTNVK